MTDFFGSILKHARRIAVVSVLAGTALLSGCASTGMGTANAENNARTAMVRPEVIYVYAFQSDAENVKLDTHGIAAKLKASLSGESSEQQQAQDAQKARDDVANEIVAKLQSMGLRAIRSEVPPPAGQNVLMVEGSFNIIDAGNRRRRTLIGLGAGKSQVGTTVQLVYKPANGAAQLIEQFDADADSGHTPGVAEMAGVGAAAGHAATSLAMSGGVHAMSETKQSGTSGDEKKLADRIAKQIAKVVGAA